MGKGGGLGGTLARCAPPVSISTQFVHSPIDGGKLWPAKLGDCAKCLINSRR